MNFTTEWNNWSYPTNQTPNLSICTSSYNNSILFLDIKYRYSRKGQEELPSPSVLDFVQNRETTGRTQGITARVVTDITASLHVMQSLDRWSKVAHDVSSIDGSATLDTGKGNESDDSYELGYDIMQSVDRWSDIAHDTSSIDGSATLDTDKGNESDDSYELGYGERELEDNTLGKVE